MLLVIDIGNTETAVGLYFKGNPDGHWRVATRSEQTTDEQAVQLSALISDAGHRLSEITGVCLASVVPTATAAVKKMFIDRFNVSPLTVDSKVKTGLKIEYDQPENVGADRIANAAGGFKAYGGPLIIVDFGTATTFDVISRAGSYLGGAIASGLSTGAEALFEKAAMLRGVVLEAPDCLVGKNTEASLRSGLIFGTAAMVDGMVAGIKKEKKTDFQVIATGGLTGLVAQHCESIDTVEPLLTLMGLKLIWQMNEKNR